MAKNNDAIKVKGEVLETLPNTMFRVKIEIKGEEREIISVLAGRMRKYFIQILPGDKVDVELSPYDLERGRIVYRHK